MIRLVVALAAGLALLAGTARADTFALVPSTAVAPVLLPSAEVPNAPGSLLLPPGWTEQAATVHALDLPLLQGLWHRAGGAYGIPWQVLASINKIESNFGRNMGPSSAGAVGWMQFMPDTWLRWGMDANADGIADPWNPEDAVYSAARYLAAAGGRLDVPRAIFAYNHADWYVREVLDLAGLYGAAGVDVTFTLDRLQVSLEEAEQAVVDVNERLVAAVREERRLARQEQRLLDAEAVTTLLSDELEAQKQSIQLGVEHAAGRAAVAALRQELALAEAALERARSGAQGAAFAPGGRTLFGAAAYSGEYVFPVGGGPGVVSVARDHHDYPAADIAAPAGSPVYALGDAIVTAAWHLPEARCGIGVTLETADGQTWTYCHLAYLEPAVQAGVILPAGTVVGLVGSTGESTGPHLHLQLQPALEYPQDQPWFQAFSGSAFTWQDGPPAGVGGSEAHPVFAVVPDASAAAEPVITFTR